jgi:uncharacterized protein YaeQ
MSFVGGFYSFNLSISNSNTGFYGDVRLRACQHPDESLEFLTARVLSLSHCTDGSAEFSEGLYDTSQPTIQAFSVIQQRTLWAQVGIVTQKTLQQQLRHHRDCRSLLYLCNQEEVLHLAGYLKGAKDNWIEHLPIYLIDATLIETLTTTLSSKNRWSVTIVGEDIYVGISAANNTDPGHFAGMVTEVYPWREFQGLHA